MSTILDSQSHSENSPGSAPPTASQLLAQLTEEQRQQLVCFARKRLRRLALTPCVQRLLALTSAEDLVDEVYHKVLAREHNPQQGRIVPVKSCASIQAFIYALEGIITSEISNWIKLAEGAFPHETVERENAEGSSLQVADPLDPLRSVAHRDLQRVLFARLRERAASEPDLLPIIDHWEPRFLEADRIAGPEFDQNLVYRVRQHARKVLWELATEADAHALDGRDMLL